MKPCFSPEVIATSRKINLRLRRLAPMEQGRHPVREAVLEAELRATLESEVLEEDRQAAAIEYHPDEDELTEDEQEEAQEGRAWDKRDERIAPRVRKIEAQIARLAIVVSPRTGVRQRNVRHAPRARSRRVSRARATGPNSDPPRPADPERPRAADGGSAQLPLDHKFVALETASAAVAVA
ncbi:MAG: hypothetical protein WKF41_16875 [Gaiellaceae bacterium]